MPIRTPLGFTFSVLGRAAAVAAVNRAGKRERNKFHGAMKEAANEIMEISQTIYVPIASGDLMKSGRVVVKSFGGTQTVEMQYGGPPKYAVIVHETNKNYRNGRQWKYLETPAKLYPWKTRFGGLYKKQKGGIRVTR